MALRLTACGRVKKMQDYMRWGAWAEGDEGKGEAKSGGEGKGCAVRRVPSEGVRDERVRWAGVLGMTLRLAESRKKLG